MERPFIKNDTNNFPDVGHQLVEYCLATRTKTADLLNCSSYFVFSFDFESFLHDCDADSSESLFYRCELLDVPLACAMAASAYYNVQHLDEIKRIDADTVANIIIGKFDPTLHIKDEDEVIVKILDLFDIEKWLKIHGCYYDKKKYKFKEFKENLYNEIPIYNHIWRHNSMLDKKDSDRFINVPKLIHSGKAPRLPMERLDVTSDSSQLDKELEASGGLNMRCLYGPYLVLEYLKDMRPPNGEEEHAEVE
ncbi:unnamed protein product [Ambrosiozyma monospora]|uniref:Unnamed protein product n=1 Tax=Ambrosiozyma monospora TaxID=43982 RepID=A0ACB5T7E7_AMBMO|nr:unnamed protein product [Ambrosiozyma monospora]